MTSDVVQGKKTTKRRMGDLLDLLPHLQVDSSIRSVRVRQKIRNRIDKKQLVYSFTHKDFGQKALGHKIC